MKKTTLITSLVLTGMVLTATSLTTLAAAGDGTTTGKVEFKTQGESSEGEVTKPDTEEEIIVPEGGNNTKGLLRLTHVPDFDFSKMEIRSETRLGNALLETYKLTDTSGQATGESKEMSHFVQVEDVRGEQKGWVLKVAATKFMPSDEAYTPLENSHIILQQGKLFNTRLDATELAQTVEGFTPGTAITNTNNSIELLNTQTGKHTDNTKTSLVFNNGYTEATPEGTFVEAAIDEEGEDIKKFNPGVQLNAIGQDLKANGVVYTATLTWTVEDAL